MAHYGVVTFASYVCRTLPARQQPAIERHVTRCQSCAETVRWLREVAALAAADTRYEPPPTLVRRARQAFARATSKNQRLRR